MKILNWIWKIITLSCCKNVKLRKYVFTILKGKHPSVRKIKLFKQNLFTFSFRFDESAKYDLLDVDQYDTNKLIGFKYGIDPHKNSARFGWRWSLDKQHIVIVGYSYVNGDRSIFDIGYCLPNESCNGEIEVTDKEFIYRFRGVEYKAAKTKNSMWKFFLFPYFGGNKKAPHNINIEMWF